jgi:hypothetical protein
MSYEIISTTHVKKSRKEYRCDISIVVRQEIDNDNQFFSRLTKEEIDSIEQAKKDNWKIPIGTEYNKHISRCDGELITNRNRVDIECIVSKYNLLDEYE